MTTIDPKSTFCAHECNDLGLQALKILRHCSVHTETISGGDPRLPTNAVVFLKMTVGSCRSSFLRTHPNNPIYPDDIERQQHLAESMSWALEGQVVFINPEHAGSQGQFVGKPLNGFKSALANLVGYVNPQSAENRQKRIRAWQNRERHNVRDRFYFGEQ